MFATIPSNSYKRTFTLLEALNRSNKNAINLD